MEREKKPRKESWISKKKLKEVNFVIVDVVMGSGVVCMCV